MLKAGENHEQLLYQVHWEAHSRAGQYRSEQRWRLYNSPAWLSSSRASSSVAVASLVAARAATADNISSLLALMQQVSRSGGPGGGIRLSTYAALPASVGLSCAAANLVSAAAWGLVRVAAFEAANNRWAAVDLDSYAADRYLAAGEAVDMSGSVVQHGLAVRPMLLPCNASASSHPAGIPVQPALVGQVLVTGGLGGEDTCWTTVSCAPDVLCQGP